jgi:hypothetical protein
VTGKLWCTFRAGSGYCVNDPCLNPRHRTPDPETQGIVPPPIVERPPPTPTQPHRRRERHCGHSRPVGAQCLYCDEGISPDDYWDMVRFLNTRRREGSRVPVKARGPKRDRNKQPNHTMRPCDMCGQPMLLNRDRECAITLGCTGWHTLEATT